MSQSQVTLQGLSSLTTSVWTQFDVTVRVQDLKKNTSQSGREYDLLMVSDSTGYRIFYNCNNLNVEVGKTYNMRIRASQDKRTTVITCFVLDSIVVHTHQSLVGTPNFDKKVLHMVLPQLYLTVENISTISDLDSQISLMDEQQPRARNVTLLLTLRDSQSKKYFYRVWKQDTEIDKEKLTLESVLCFTNVSVSKKQDSPSLSLTKNKFTTVVLEEDFLV